MPKFLRRHSAGGSDHCRARKFPYRTTRRTPRRRRRLPRQPGVDRGRRRADHASRSRQDSPGFARHAGRQRHQLRFPRARRRARHVVRPGPIRLRARGKRRLAALRAAVPRAALRRRASTSSSNAFALDVRNGTDFRRSVRLRRPQRRRRTGTAKTDADPRSSSCARRARSRCATRATNPPTSNN